jgi:hypothetical protein
MRVAAVSLCLFPVRPLGTQPGTNDPLQER